VPWVIRNGRLLLCKQCAVKVRLGEGVHFKMPDSSGVVAEVPPEQRFAELFKAARILLSEGTRDESVIIPTLAFAAEIGQGVVSCLEARERVVAAWRTPEAGGKAEARFPDVLGNHRSVGVVNDVILLERRPLSCSVDLGELGTSGQLLQARITVALSGKLPTPELVAHVYEETLTAENVSYGGSESGSISYDFREDLLVLSVGHGRLFDARLLTLHDVLEADPRRFFKEIELLKPRVRFLRPRLVQQFYRITANEQHGKGDARFPTVRKRGRPWEPINLIPACVAFYLKYYGKIFSPMKVHKVLNEYVLREASTVLPEAGVSSSESNQLWRTVKSVQSRVLQESRLHHRRRFTNTFLGE
jgi:hypothetical protein